MADLERLREDPAYFAHEIGVEIEPWQADAIRVHKREARETAILGPRRAGKSRTAAILALWWTVRHPGETVVVVSASEARARDLLATARRIATRSPLLAGSVTADQAFRLDLTNGSTLRCVPSTDSAARGLTASLVIVDEAAQQADSILLGALRPIISSEPHGRFVMISSALRASGAFYDAVRRAEAGSENVTLFRWSIEDCSWILPSEVEAARESLGDVLFRAEYLGEFASGMDALFDRQMLEPCLVDYELTPLAELAGPARLAAGVDWGATHDRSVFTALGRVPGRAQFGVVCQRRWDVRHPLSRVVDEIASSPGHFHYVVSEVNGMGFKPTDDLFGLIERRSPRAGGGKKPRYVVIEDDGSDMRSDRERLAHLRRPAAGFVTISKRHTTSSASKAAMYSALRFLVERQQILIPTSAEQLVKELLMLRVDLTASGTERVEAGSGHDDCADSLAMALGPYRPKSQASTPVPWSIKVSEYADPRARVPDPLLPAGAFRAPTFDDTGRGRPAWQSVNGPELTVPPGLDLSDPRAHELRDEIRAVLDQRRKDVAA